MKRILRLLIFFAVVGLLIYYVGLKHGPASAPIRPVAVERRPDLTAIFSNGRTTSSYVLRARWLRVTFAAE